MPTGKRASMREGPLADLFRKSTEGTGEPDKQPAGAPPSGESHAASDEPNSPSDLGIVRVDCWPSWWQPTHERFFTTVSQSAWVMFAGMLLLPPNWLSSGIFIIEYQ